MTANPQESAEVRAREGVSVQAAFDSGAGRRCWTHDRANPYNPGTQPAAHAAWQRGWEKTDREANNVR